MACRLPEQYWTFLFAEIIPGATADTNFFNTWGEWIFKFIIALLPFAIFALVIHALEKTIQKRLAPRFGWSSILATGWIGTPVHELSHVVMCWVFGHRIDAVAFFEPDRKSGRLGYVKHSNKKNSVYQEVGNLFVGIAPLIGGSLVLLLLFWIFYPALAQELGSYSSENSTLSASDQAQDYLAAIGSNLWKIEMFTPRFFLFSYLVLCVGSHMAPSRSDYAGATKGAFLLIALTLIFSATISFFPGLASQSNELVLLVAMQMWPLLGIVIVMTMAAALVVWLSTAIWDLVVQS